MPTINRRPWLILCICCMSLLIVGTDATIDTQDAAVEVRGLAVDSRAVKPGDLFFALTGHKTEIATPEIAVQQ